MKRMLIWCGLQIAAVLAAVSYGQAPEPGLIAYYPFNGNVMDESGNGHTGIVVGATPDFSRFGEANKAYYFDGVDDFINLDAWASMIPTGSDNFSISVWAKWQSLAPVNESVVVSYGGNVGNVGFLLCYQVIDYLEFAMAQEYPNWVRAHPEPIIHPVMGQWYHLAVTYDHSNVSFYIDGELVAQAPYSGDLRPATTLRIGCEINDDPATGYYHFNGAIDDVRFYNIALSESRVKALHNDLIASYPFNGNAKDASGNGNDGTATGATPAADRCGGQNRAYFFDGSNDEIWIPDNPSFDLTGTNSLSISCWINVATWTYGAGIWCKAALGEISNYCLTLDPSNKLILIVNHYDQGATQEELFTNGTFVLNTWYHCVVVFNNKTATIYINGSLDATHQFTKNFGPNNRPLYIGNDTDGQSEFFTGAIDDILIFRHALSEAEIQALYLDQCPPTLLGDVNDDDAVNSTDALLVLSCDADVPAASFCPMYCGDVNGDGAINSTDALIILSYNVGLSVPFAVAQIGCPTVVIPCSGCNE